MSSNNKSEALKQGDKAKDLSDVEMIFGTPQSTKSGQPDIHLITNERRIGKEPLPNHNKRGGSDSDTDAVPTQPLLEPDKGRPKPPLAGPEIDDLDDERDEERKTDAPYPGIDDGLLEPGDKKPEGHDNHGQDDDEHKDENGIDIHRDEGPDGKWWHEGGDETDFPYGDLLAHDGINGFGPRFGVDDRPISPMIPGSIPDVNTYQQKKNLAQGMMDLALLSANANQLRYVLESSAIHPYYYPSLVFISFSIILQIAVGVGLIMNSRYNVKDDKDICKADKINNMTVLGVFLVTIVNVFITSFSVAGNTTTSTVPGTAVQTQTQG